MSEASVLDLVARSQKEWARPPGACGVDREAPRGPL